MPYKEYLLYIERSGAHHSSLKSRVPKRSSGSTGFVRLTAFDTFFSFNGSTQIRNECTHDVFGFVKEPMKIVCRNESFRITCDKSAASLLESGE